MPYRLSYIIRGYNLKNRIRRISLYLERAFKHTQFRAILQQMLSRLWSVAVQEKLPQMLGKQYATYKLSIRNSQ